MLQDAFDAVQATQANAKMLQRWGSTVPMPVTNGAALPTAQVQVINIGPFPEPRHIMFDEFFAPNDGGSPSELEPGAGINAQLLYYFTIGIGLSSVSYVVDQLPQNLMCQSLSVSVARNDNNVVGFQYSCWAAPYVPRGEPMPLTNVTYQFGAGTPSIVIGGPPNFATHVMAGFDSNDAVDGYLYLQCSTFQSPLYRAAVAPPAAASRLLLWQRSGATAGGSYIASPIYPIPKPTSGLLLTRSPSVVGISVVLTWLRA